MSKKLQRHKNTDNIDLLVTYDEFQDAIKEIRKFLEIPRDGFTNDVEIKNWTKESDIKSDEITTSQKFIDQENKLSEQVKIKKITPKQANEKWKEMAKIIPCNYLENTINQLIDKFNLPEHYNHFLRRYIISNTVIYPSNSFTIKPSRNKKSVQVNIHMRLTNEDLQEVKEYVNKYFGKNLPHAQQLTDLPTKLEIEKLYNTGEEIDAVTGKTYRTNAEDIAEKIYKDKTKKNSIHYARQNLKSMRKRRFSDE